MLKASAAFLGCALGAAAIAGSPAAAQGFILIPQGQDGGQAGGQRYLLMPSPDGASQDRSPRAQAMQERQAQAMQERRAQMQDRRAQRDAQGRDPSRSLALELYRRGYEQGMTDARGASAGTIDPAEVERIGRELFDRGYALGLMQARAEFASQGGAQSQASAQGQGGQTLGGDKQARQALRGQEHQGMRNQMSSDASGSGDASDPLVQPGRYRAGPFTAHFREDGSFQMSRTDKERTVTGDYTVEGADLILNEATGDIGRATFPMTCRAERIEDGFRLTGSAEGCQELVGMEFIRRQS